MAKATTILVIAKDAALRAEIEDALPGATEQRVVVHDTVELGRGLEAARRLEPQIVCADFGADTGALRALALDLRAAAPEAILAAAYRRDVIGEGEAESGFLLQALRGRVQDVLRRPIASADLRQLLERLDEPRGATGKRPAGEVVTLTSNKGGVGKSTLATNTACALALHHPDEVLLIDAALQLGVCRALLDLDAPTALLDAVRERERLDETLLRQLTVLHSCGLHLLAAPTDAVEAAEIDDESLTRVVTLARRSFRYVIVDTFPMLDNTLLTLLDLADRAYVALQGTVPDVIGTARHIAVLERLGLSEARRAVVLNRNYVRHAGQLTAADIEERLGVGIDHTFPYRRGLLVAQNTGIPYVLSHPSQFGFGRAIWKLARDIEARAVSAEAGWPR